MKIALFGATGATGLCVIDQALAAGHSVTALVRDPTKLPARDGLSIVQGHAQDAAAVGKVIAGADVVLSTLGNFNRKPNTEMSDATRVITQAMAGQGVRRLIVVTTIGVGDSFKPLRSLIFKLVIRTFAREIWRDRERQEAVIRASGLDWTIVRPGGLRNQPGQARYQVIDGGGVQPKKVAIARADVAHFLLAAAADPAMVGRTVCLFD
jgi:putative NADH-flavin reductase